MLDPARLAAAPILGEGLKQLVDEHEGPADTHITADVDAKHTVYGCSPRSCTRSSRPQLGRKKGALLFLEFASTRSKAFKMTSFGGRRSRRVTGWTAAPRSGRHRVDLRRAGDRRRPARARKQFMIVAVLLFLFIAIATT